MFVLCTSLGWAQSGFYVDGLGWLNNTPSGTTGGDNFSVISGSPSFGSNVAMNDLDLSPGTTTTISAGFSVTLNGILEGSGLITIEQGGQLIQTGGGTNTFSGTGNIQAGGQGNSDEFNFVSSPMTSTSLTSQFGGSNVCDMHVFDAPNQDWGWDIAAGTYTCTYQGNQVQATFDAGNSVSGADGIMDRGRGYTITGGGQPTYSGVFNNGTVSIGVSSPGVTNPGWSGTSWNFIGNPYPSAIGGNDFINGNSAINGTIYFWDDPATGGGFDENNDFATYTLAGGSASNSGVVPNGSVAVGQGFFVSARSNGTVSFTNAMRGGDNSQFFKTEDPIKRVWLNATDAQGYVSNILVAFTDSATEDYDYKYDGERFVAQQPLLFGSQINLDGCYAITAQNPLETTDREIDLRLRVATSNVVSISIDQFQNFYDDKEIFIVDTETGKSQNLGLAPFAVYLQAQQNYDGRFKLVFKHKAPTSIAELDQAGIQAFVSQNQLVVDFNGTTQQSLQIISLNGEIITQTNVSQQSQFVLAVSELSSGIYFVRCADKNNKISTKKVAIL
jgi:hypothetical protein